ncbi:ABC transporter permease [Ferviditalea candida]|uniref:ABC transporter permease n=1 Tax=Ferviditalea candida TaxID=3108399 RepID=A0ABU5ZN86_9BACL|nr:ABC transporter permease [Paenibacillaceae bacterium T2]
MNTRRASTLYYRTAETFALWIGLILLWQLLTSLFHAFFFPTPLEIAKELGRNWLSITALQHNALPSLFRIISGWGLASVFGIMLGVAIGLVRGLDAYFEPIIHFGRAISPPAALPIFLILFGIGDSMKILFIAFGVIWPILLNTVKGVQSIDSTQLNSARVYGIRGIRHLFYVILPAASPEIFAGLRISLALAFIMMVISEMISASGGIGYMILQSQANFDILSMWAGMVILGIGGILFNSLFLALEAYFLRWQRGSAGISA